MSRKTFLIAAVLIVCAGLAYFFWIRRPSSPVRAPEPTPCLALQNTDPSQPCYDANLPTSGASPASGQPLPGAEEPVAAAPDLATPLGRVDAACGDSSNVFERDDCIRSLAEEKKDGTICDYVSGSLGQSQCRASVQTGPNVAAPVPVQSPSASYQSFVEQYFSDTQKKPIVSQPSPSTSTAPAQNEPQPTPDISSTLADQQKFAYNMSFGAPLAVYAPSKYQVAPGGAIKIYGSGFATTNNTLNIGAFQSTVNSADGTTLAASAPLAVGEYEIWVTNSKGTSKVADRPVKLTVTDSPAPVPSIERASPSPVSIDGTVTLTGTGFGSTNNVLTSLGNLMNVPSNGTSISFAVSSLPYASYAKQTAALKGKISPVYVNIQTAGGAAEKVFQFDVQF